MWVTGVGALTRSMLCCSRSFPLTASCCLKSSFKGSDKDGGGAICRAETKISVGIHFESCLLGSSAKTRKLLLFCKIMSLPLGYAVCSVVCHLAGRSLCTSHIPRSTGALVVLYSKEFSASLRSFCGSEGTQSKGWSGRCGMARFHPA